MVCPLRQLILQRWFEEVSSGTSTQRRSAEARLGTDEVFQGMHQGAAGQGSDFSDPIFSSVLGRLSTKRTSNSMLASGASSPAAKKQKPAPGDAQPSHSNVATARLLAAEEAQGQLTSALAGLEESLQVANTMNEDFPSSKTLPPTQTTRTLSRNSSAFAVLFWLYQWRAMARTLMTS